MEDAPVGMFVERMNLELNFSPPSSSYVPLTETRPTHLRTIHKRILRRSTPNPSPRFPNIVRDSLRKTKEYGTTSEVSVVWKKTISSQHILQECIQALHDNWTIPGKGF